MAGWFSSPNTRNRVILIVLIAALLIFLLVSAWKALVPFFLGAILAYLLLPIVNFLDNHAPKFMRRRRISRPLAIIIVYILGIAFVVGLFSSFIPTVTDQFNALLGLMPGLLNRLESLVTVDVAQFLQRIPPEIQDTVNANIEKALASLGDALQKGIVATLTTLSQTVSFIIGMLIVPFWLFYVLNDSDKARRSIYALIPEPAREDVRCITLIIDDLLSAYVRGQLLLCVLVGAMATVVLLLLGVDLALLLGTFAGIFEIVPILGPYLGAIPAILIALLKRPILALWVALAYAAIQQIENVFLVPRISGRAVRFHPAVVMVIVVVGSQVAGVLGVLLGVPVAAVLRDVFQYLLLRTTERGATPEMALETLRAKSL